MRENKPIINSIVYILLGILLCVFKSQLISWMLTAMGIYYIIRGIVDVAEGNTPVGVLHLGIGCLIILGGWLFIELILIICGILFVLRGIMLLIAAADVRSVSASLNAVLTLFLGILLIVSKWVVFNWFFVIIGITLIVDGISALIAEIE